MKLNHSVCLTVAVQIAHTSAFHTFHIASKLKSQRINSSFLPASYLDQLSSGQSAASQPQATQGTGSYLDQLSSGQLASPEVAQVITSVPSPEVAPTPSSSGISYAPPDYFALSNLQSKGPRKADWGIPTEATRKLDDDGILRVGAWYCSEGGWPSPNPKAHTEIFYVLEGHGCLTDADGMKHYFGPGDTVNIPKGHTGRWDVYEPIRKVWAVNDHARIEEDTSKVIRVQVYHYCHLSPQYLHSNTDPLFYSSPSIAQCETLYGVGPTKVGVWLGEAGTSIAVSNGQKSFLYLLEGILYVSNDNTGEAVRMSAGDTVMLPQWSGYVDVIESCKMLWTTAD